MIKGTVKNFDQDTIFNNIKKLVPIESVFINSRTNPLVTCGFLYFKNNENMCDFLDLCKFHKKSNTYTFEINKKEILIFKKNNKLQFNDVLENESVQSSNNTKKKTTLKRPRENLSTRSEIYTNYDSLSSDQIEQKNEQLSVSKFKNLLKQLEDEMKQVKQLDDQIKEMKRIDNQIQELKKRKKLLRKVYKNKNKIISLSQT